MKKVILLAMCMVLMGAGAAMATVYTDINGTSAIGSNGTLYAAPLPGNVIGDTNVFETFKAVFDSDTGLLTITTNWNPGKDGSVSSLVKTADLFIKIDGHSSWDYAINLDNTTLTQNETVYKAPLTYDTSDTVFSGSSGLIYGKYYDAVGQFVPVHALTTSDGTKQVVWSSLTSTDTNNTVTVDLSGLLTSDPWSFIWGTATCSNGPFADGFPTGVPLPPSALLLGSGLLGLVGLGWRRRKTNV